MCALPCCCCCFLANPRSFEKSLGFEVTVELKDVRREVNKLLRRISSNLRCLRRCEDAALSSVSMISLGSIMVTEIVTIFMN